MKKYPRTVAVMVWFGDKILLAKRLKTKTFSGFWEAPGGKVESGESLTEAVQRELLEETDFFIPTYGFEVIDAITDDPTTDKFFLFRAETHILNFKDVENTEKKKRTPWELFSVEEAKKLNLMPGLYHNLIPPS